MRIPQFSSTSVTGKWSIASSRSPTVPGPADRHRTTGRTYTASRAASSSYDLTRSFTKQLRWFCWTAAVLSICNQHVVWKVTTAASTRFGKHSNKMLHCTHNNLLELSGVQRLVKETIRQFGSFISLLMGRVPSDSSVHPVLKCIRMYSEIKLSTSSSPSENEGPRISEWFFDKLEIDNRQIADWF